VPGPPAARKFQGGVGNAAYAQEIASQLDSWKIWRSVYGSSGRFCLLFLLSLLFPLNTNCDSDRAHERSNPLANTCEFSKFFHAGIEWA
jgi:hypothetical protein